MKATSLREAIIRIFQAEPELCLGLKDIYRRIPGLFDLSEEQNERDEKYLAPRFEHEARGIIAALEKENVIERLDRDRRRLKAKKKTPAVAAANSDGSATKQTIQS